MYMDSAMKGIKRWCLNLQVVLNAQINIGRRFVSNILHAFEVGFVKAHLLHNAVKVMFSNQDHEMK